MFRAGDSVFHAPTGETWTLACDEENGEVVACGWPETLAYAKDCTLRKCATDAERLDLLHRAAASRGDDGCSTLRSRRASRQLASLMEPKVFHPGAYAEVEECAQTLGRALTETEIIVLGFGIARGYAKAEAEIATLGASPARREKGLDAVRR